FDDEPVARAYDAANAERLYARSAWPQVEWSDTGANLALTVELPGFGEKDVQLSIHQDLLTIAGERKTDAPAGYVAHRQERLPVKFTRTYSLPTKVDPERSSAALKNGVLTVTLAKSAEAQPKQIAVRAQ